MSEHHCNVYEVCPVFENAHFLLRLIEEKDASDLLSVYNNTVQYNALDTDDMLGVESFEDADAVSVEDAVIARMMTEKLLDCLITLPEAERKYIFQRYWEGKSRVELASKCGASQQVLSYHEKRILAKLKKLIEK